MRARIMISLQPEEVRPDSGRVCQVNAASAISSGLIAIFFPAGSPGFFWKEIEKAEEDSPSYPVLHYGPPPGTIPGDDMRHAIPLLTALLGLAAAAAQLVAVLPAPSPPAPLEVRAKQPGCGSQRLTVPPCR